MDLELTYLITNGQVYIYQDAHPFPIIHQPDWPNGAPWSSDQEAATWAQLCILSISDPTAPYAPAGPGLEGEAKPSGYIGAGE